MKQIALWKRRFSPFLTGKETENRDGGVECTAWCPIHQDPDTGNSPAAQFNFEKGVWHCKSKDCQNDVPSFKTLYDMIQEDEKEEGSESKKKPEKFIPLPSPSQIQRWQKNLMSDPDLLDDFIERRGLILDTIEKFQIGYESLRREPRFTIPIYDRDGILKDVRKYRPNTRDSKNKMISHTGHGGKYLYPVQSLEEETIIIAEGELDALTLVQRGFAGLSATSGTMGWDPTWGPLFKDKKVFICYDDDDAGKRGARKVAENIRRHTPHVYIINLILPGIRNGDVTDFFVKSGKTRSDFLDLMVAAEESLAGQPRRSKKIDDENPIDVSVESSIDAGNVGIPLRLRATVSGKGVSPSHVPKRVNATCDLSWGDKCKKCFLAEVNGTHDTNVDKKDDILINMVGRPTEVVHKLLLKNLGIQQNCPKVDVYEDESWNVEELTVQQAVDEGPDILSGGDSSPVTRTVFNVVESDARTKENDTYEFIGISIPNPKDRYSIFQSWNCKRVGTDVDNFEMTEKIKAQLEIFQVEDEWNEASPYEKMMEIADDMAYNVTGIFGRPILHMAYDIVWHSILDFNFAGKPIGRGYVDAIAIGDTRTGKSEIATYLLRHYQAGTLKSLDRSSVAGIVGGGEAKGSNRQWGVTWGILPRNHRRMVIFDEAGAAKPQVFEQLTSVRSSGIAEVNLMGGQRAPAKTRLLWITNPIENKSLKDLPRGGMDGIKEIFKAPEDIARFDFAMAVDGDEVPPEMIKKENNEQVWHAYHSEDCKMLITWAWSRKPEHVVFEEGLEDKIFAVAEDFSRNYIDDPPLVQPRDFRIKLARITVAIAARVFSTDDSGEMVIVKFEHLYTAVKFLETIYQDPKFGYAKYSSDVLRRVRRNQRDKEDLQDWMEMHEDALSVLISMRYRKTFKKRDFEEVGHGIDSMEASEVMGYLTDKEMILDVGEGKYKFTDILKEVVNEAYENKERLRDLEHEEENFG